MRGGAENFGPSGNAKVDLKTSGNRDICKKKLNLRLDLFNLGRNDCSAIAMVARKNMLMENCLPGHTCSGRRRESEKQEKGKELGWRGEAGSTRRVCLDQAKKAGIGWKARHLPSWVEHSAIT